jgi:hypothetical protein
MTFFIGVSFIYISRMEPHMIEIESYSLVFVIVLNHVGFIPERNVKIS